MEATLEATRRTTFGKNEAVRLRRSGRIPAVLYGGETRQAESLTVDPKALLRILRSHAGVNTLIALHLEGAPETRVLVKQYLLDPVDHSLLHADFFRVAMDKVITVTVQVHLTGEAKGVKAEGGVVEFVNRSLEVECLPADIPEHITVDVTELMLHEGVRVRDLPTDGKWKAVSDADMLIVHVTSVKVEAAPEPTAAEAAAALAAAPAAPAEPEVIKKGKIDKDEDDGKPAKAEGKPAKPEGKAPKAEGKGKG